MNLASRMTIWTKIEKVETIKEVIKNSMNPIGEIEVHTINSMSLIWFRTLKSTWQIVKLFREANLEPRDMGWNDIRI